MKATGGRPGRPARPVEVKRALGNPGHRPLPSAPTPATALETVTGIPAPPEDLPEKAVDAWCRLWAAGRAHLSPSADYVLMEQLCRGLGEKHALRCWLEEDYFARAWTTTDSGRAFPHPALRRIEQLDAQTTSWLAQLGFTPSDRARLGLLEVRTPDELDQFRRRAATRQEPS